MQGKQNIYYALGILAYAVAKADGEVQQVERDKFIELIEQKLKHSIDSQYAEIIFQLLEKDHSSYQGVYSWAMEELKKAKTYITPELKIEMIEALEEVSMAMGEVTHNEASLIERFKKDLKLIDSLK